MTGATEVTFNGVAATVFSVNNEIEITATVPSGATTGPIAVTTPDGTFTSATSFTVTVPPPPPAPTLNSFTPVSGLVGTTVTLIGTDLTGATEVAFHGTAATVFSVDNASQITATVPAGATTGTIAVTTPGGTGTSAASFTVSAPPTPTVTAPTGTSTYVQDSAVTVAWSANFPVASGEFGVWAVSSTGSWYVGDLVPAHGAGANYTHDLTLSVPIGAGYSIAVYYRPTAGSGAWQSGAWSPGTFTVN